MRTYDVIIVGAGPAGSTAARLLAAHGLAVLLIDAKKLPRDKPCAGVVSAKTLSLLEQEGLGVPQDLVEAEIYGLKAFGPHMEPVYAEPAYEVSGISLPGRPRLGITVRRRAFDWFLTEPARNAGARLIDDCRLLGLSGVGETSQGPSALPALSLDTSKGEFEARVVIGADGVFSATARLAGIRPRFRWWELARTCSMDISVAHIANCRNRPAEDTGVRIDGGSMRNAGEICFPPVLFGSGWLFPHGDHVNVGIGCAAFAFTRRMSIKTLWSTAPAIPTLPSPPSLPLASFPGEPPSQNEPLSQSKPHQAFLAFLDSLARAKGWEIRTISPAKQGGPKEYLVPAGGFRRPIARGQVLLVGDAAGLVDPFTGEGIFNAMRSANIAAETIAGFLGRDHDDYGDYDNGVPGHPLAREYTRRCYGALLPELRRSLLLTAIFFNKGGLFFRLLRRDPRRVAWLAEIMHSEGAYGRILSELAPWRSPRD
ncbi:MAG: NAD(P)/FAD-dependent oxidoreductase [Firmicutes bacterium]|nr:NAD(P)/FAD-dependent oxidoreductase [Bacillota bacterium]